MEQHAIEPPLQICSVCVGVNDGDGLTCAGDILRTGKNRPRGINQGVLILHPVVLPAGRGERDARGRVAPVDTRDAWTGGFRCTEKLEG